MKKQTKHDKEASIEELYWQSISVQSVKDSILPAINEQLKIPGSDIIEVRCGICNREMWTKYYEEGITFICGTCSNQYIPK